MIKKIFISGFDAQAITLFNEDDDYFMAAATCYMRLNKYDEALRMLQTVIDRSPNNFKALYHYAFCQRASGSQKNAIEGLTKVSLRCCDCIY
jgi:tetratricopeptide (TPR) repeat protein